MVKDIDPKLKLISNYLKIEKDEMFVIPEYQRGYSWNIMQCDKLWQDIETFIEAGDAQEPYFLGTIIVDCSKNKCLSLIDGQQRTTTFILLLKALQLRLQEVLKNFKSDEASANLKKFLSKRLDKTIEILFKADDELTSEILDDWNIVTKQTDILINNSINELYTDELSKIIIAPDYKTAEFNCHKIARKQKDNKYTNFFRNFKFFYEKLENYKESQLNNFAKKFLENCQIIEIRSWQVEQAITMFNSLNSTGMPLSDADIISAQMYSNAGADKKKFNDIWKQITKLANELNSRKITNIDAILQQNMYILRATNEDYNVTTPGLRNYYTVLNKDILKDPWDLCDKLKKIAEIWDKIKDYPIIKLLLKFNDNAKIYLMSYINRFEPEKLLESNVSDITECLLRLFTILEIVDAGYSSSYFKTFLFKENINLVSKDYPIEKIKKEFDEHINNSWDKDKLTQLLIEYDKNVLVFLNEYLYAKENEFKFDFAENVNIEHIMPASGRNIDAIRIDAKIANQDEFDSIVNKLGNKILLEEDINKSISNEWFKTKKQNSVKDKAGYKDSTYKIAQSLVNYPSNVWTKEDIDKATQKAAERILEFIFNSNE